MDAGSYRVESSRGVCFLVHGFNMAKKPPGAIFNLTEVGSKDGRSRAGRNKQKAKGENDPTLNTGKGIVNDIMMVLDMDKVLDLQEEFQKADNGLTIYEFVYVMKRFIATAVKNTDDNTSHNLANMTETMLASALAELFAQIDINGDGTMEWEEFTSYIVESGLSGNDEPDGILKYEVNPWEDFSKHRSNIERMYFFPKDPAVSSGSIGLVEAQSPLLKIYNSECSPVHHLKAPRGHVLAAGHIQDLKQYVMTSSDLSISFYDDTSYRLHKSFHTPVSQMCIEWDTTTKTLFSSGISGAIYAWDPEKMEERYHMGGTGRDGRLVRGSHQDMVLGLKTLNGLETLASASMDKTIRLWDTTTGSLRRTLEGHEKGVRSLAYNDDYRFLVSGGFDYDALVWNPYVERLILRLHGHTAPLCGVEMVQNTPQIITADVSGIVKIWDIRTFTCMQTFSKEDEGTTAAISSFVNLPKKQRIVIGGRKMHIFDYQKLENPELSGDSPVVSVYYNDTLMSFVTATTETVQMWDANGKLTRTFRNLSGKGVTTMMLDDRKRKFIVGDFAGNVKVFDYLSGVYMKKCDYKEFGQKAHAGEISKMVYIHKYKCFISASWDRGITIHDENEADGCVLLRRIDNAHKSDISALAYSQHLSMIVSGCSDGKIKFWDYEFVRSIGVCHGHAGGINDIVFVGTYPIVASCDSKGLICLWGTTGKHKGVCLSRIKNLARDSQHATKNVTKMHAEVEWSEPVGQVSTEEMLYQEMKLSVRRKVMSKSKHLRELFRQIGGDGDGKIDLQEFKSAMLNFGVGVGMKDQIERLFYEIDDDSSGMITYDEFSEGLTHLTSNDDFNSDDEDGIAADGSDGRYVVGAKLYTGDEEGIMKVWDLFSVMQRLEREHDIFPIRRVKKCENPMRSLRFDASEQVSTFGKTAAADEGKSEEDFFHQKTGGGIGPKVSDLVGGPTPLLSNKDIEPVLLQAWDAHNYGDAIVDFQLIRHPAALITSGNDRMVKIWSRAGELLGQLQQGWVDSSRWKFRVDMTEHNKRQTDQATKIITTINDMIEDEERKRWEGGEFQNPIFDTPKAPAYESAMNTEGSAISYKHPALNGMAQLDAVNLHIEDIHETSERLINELSNLSIRERDSRVGGIADKVRKTPRLRPVDPKHAGKGYSITPYGRSMRSAGLRQFKKKGSKK